MSMRKVIFVFLVFFVSQSAFAYEYKATYVCYPEVDDIYQNYGWEKFEITHKKSSNGDLFLEIVEYDNYTEDSLDPYSDEWSEGMISETIAYRSINPELIYFDFVTRFQGVDPYELQENNLVKIDRKRIYHWEITDNKKKYFYKMDEITVYDDLGSENNSITGSGYCFLKELN